MNDKTKFLATPGRVTSTMRAIMVSNNFSVAGKQLTSRHVRTCQLEQLEESTPGSFKRDSHG